MDRTDEVRVKRTARFRGKLIAVVLGTSLLPVMVWAAIGQATVERLGALSLGRLEGLLERVDGALGARPADTALAGDLEAARLSLAQAELARQALVRRAPLAVAGVVALSLGAALVAAVLFGRALLRPLERLAAGMQRYGKGELGHRLAEAGRRDELGQLARAFNHMGDELARHRDRLLEAQQIAVWQDVARTMAHDLRNPLTAMRMALGRLARVHTAPEDRQRLAEAVALLDEEVSTLQRMTQSFAEFARLPALAPRPLDLSHLCAELCALYGAADDVQLVSEGPLELVADPDQLRRALGNLIKNAVEAARGAPVRVCVEDAGTLARVRVEDGGPGIAALIEGDALARLGRSDKPGGSGLGLPIAHKIVHDHGGRLALAPRPHGGTVALVELPKMRDTPG